MRKFLFRVAGLSALVIFLGGVWLLLIEALEGASRYWGYLAGAGYATLLWAIREIWVQWRFEKTGRL